MSKTSKRYLNEMAEMFELPNELYTMKRGLKQKGELRYDITEIPALTINGHFNKTKGHIHSTGHQELYIVLEGEATFFFQKMWAEKIEDCYYVQAKKGECVIIPRDYFHITINTGNNLLKLGNWVSDKCVSDYSFLEKKKGMCFYFLRKNHSETGESFLISMHKNPNYKIPKKVLTMKEPLQAIPKDLSFLS